MDTSTTFLYFIIGALIFISAFLFLKFQKFTISKKVLELRGYQHLLSLVLNNYFTFSIDMGGNFIHVGSSIENILGITPDDVYDKQWSIFNSEVEDKKHLIERITSGDNTRTYTFISTAGGNNKDIELKNLRMVYNKKGTPIKIEGIAHDITEIRERERCIEKLAYYDSLTSLPNRLLFNQKSHSMVQCVDIDSMVGIFLIDVDDFKQINDTYGHIFGDKVLKEIGMRLEDVSNNYFMYDKKVDFIASRLGGDEFVIAVRGLTTKQQTLLFAKTLEENLCHPITIDGERDNFPTVSMGISLAPYHGTDISTLLKTADLALYSSKEKGKGQFTFYDSSMIMKLEEKIKYERILNYFIETGNFNMTYQVQTNLENREVVGMEALFEGNQEIYPLLDKGTFFSVAEESPKIVTLGKMILDKTLADFSIMKKEGINVPVSINVSIKQLEQPDFVETIKGKIKKYNLNPSDIELEITETSFMKQFTSNSKKLNELHNFGIKLAIDDFGVGYSSMSYIKKLPADKIKIDISFVRGIDTDRKLQEITKALLLMSNTLGLKTVAEGVETQNQFNFLKKYDCFAIQGFYDGFPQTTEIILKRLKSTTPVDTFH